MDTNGLFSAQAMLASRRDKAEAEAEARKKELIEKIPELAGIYAGISAVIPKLLQLGVKGGDDYEAGSNALHEEHERLINRKKELLRRNGYDEDYDLPQYTCKLCRDTGMADGRVCRCVKQARARHAYYASGLGKALENQSFDTFDLSYCRGTVRGVPVRKLMGDLAAYCRSYAEGFAPGAENLLFTGGSGLGKTHMASAIGKVVIDKGYSVVYEGAKELVDAYEAEHFGRSADVDVGRFTSCDLLIIDDLGTEFVTQFSLSVLFSVLNHRIINGLSTIVTTNLGFDDIKSVYKERICSRFIGDYKTLVFCGDDVREIKRDGK